MPQTKSSKKSAVKKTKPKVAEQSPKSLSHPSPKKRRIIVVVALAIVILGVLLLVRAASNHSNGFALYTVTKQDVIEEVVLAGRVQSVQRSDIGFDVVGRVSQVYVEEGQAVSKGQVIARLDSARVRAELSEAQAALQIAKVDSEVAAVDLSSAQDQLSAVQNEQDEIVANAFKNLLSNDLQAYADDADTNAVAPVITGTYVGLEPGSYSLEVYSSGSRSGYSFRFNGLEQGVETASTDSPVALGSNGLFIEFADSGNYANTDWTIEIPNTRSASYVANLTVYENALKARESALATASEKAANLSAQESRADNSRSQAVVAQAQARVDALNAQLSDYALRAPFAGVLGVLDLEIGENVAIGTQVASVIADQQFEIELDVPEIDIAKLSVGDEVVITLDAYLDPEAAWPGTITAISPVESFVDGVPVYETTVSILDNDERIRSGMNARAKIVTQQRQNVIAIPQAYVLRQNRNPQVRIRRADETYETADVKLGLVGTNNLVEITDGLSDGQIVGVRKLDGVNGSSEAQ